MRTVRVIADGIGAALASSGNNGVRAALRRTGMLVCILMLVCQTGCAPKIYNVNMRYQPTKSILPAVIDGRQYSLTVSTFIDRRKVEDTLVIGKVVQSEGSSIPILPKYARATDAVASALRELLIQSGYGVSQEKVLWDLEEKSVLPEWGTILVGGAIDELDVTCLDRIPTKLYTAKARLTLVFADVQKRRIFYRVTSESSSSLEHVLFSEERLESQINGVLSDAIEKILEGSETSRQIREAIRQ